MTSTSTSPATSLRPVFSEGEDPAKMQEALGELLIDDNGSGGGRGKWKLASEGKGVERVVKFKTFKTTMVSLFCAFLYRRVGGSLSFLGVIRTRVSKCYEVELDGVEVDGRRSLDLDSELGFVRR